jgi:hypothetical protein
VGKMRKLPSTARRSSMLPLIRPDKRWHRNASQRGSSLERGARTSFS